MDSRKRSRLYDADTASVALLEASDDDSTDSEEEPCMQNDETDSSFLLSDYDELNLLSDSDTESTTSDSNSDQTPPGTSSPATPSAWSTQGSARSRFPFTGNPGLKVNVENKEDPLSFFELYFDASLISLIVEQTNLYAQQVLTESAGRQKKRSRTKAWKDTDAGEIKLYLAVLLLQGIVHKPKETLYFSKKASLSTPFFRRIMTCDRFLLL